MGKNSAPKKSNFFRTGNSEIPSPVHAGGTSIAPPADPTFRSRWMNDADPASR